jgi:hypothetical protein
MATYLLKAKKCMISKVVQTNGGNKYCHNITALLILPGHIV